MIVANPSLIKEEINNIKTNLIKDHNIKRQKNLYWSKSIRNTIFNEYPNWDYVVNFQDKVNAVTCQQIAHQIDRCFLKTPVIRTVLLPKNTNK